jgi:hypothetical protein
MPRGDSGRIVIEVDPEMKRRLYVALALSGSTLKDWFVKNATRFCEDCDQPSLFGDLARGIAKETNSTKNGIS